jgi:ATP-dependent RNA helicase RhlE
MSYGNRNNAGFSSRNNAGSNTRNNANSNNRNNSSFGGRSSGGFSNRGNFRSYRGSNSNFSRYSKNSGRSRHAKKIDPNLYINRSVQNLETVDYQPQRSFNDFGFLSVIQKNIEARGYQTPTPIQDQAIPALMEGRDVVGIAQTGSGKTAAFLLPMLNKIINNNQQGVLILSPTRELALQTFEELKHFATDVNIGIALCIGGMNIVRQIERLKKNPHFVIGTPGRIKDLLQRGSFKPELYTNIVLDEVDRMLDIGFRKDIQFLIDQLPTERHAAFFSATMSSDVESIMQSLLTDPVRITVVPQQSANHIHQDVVRVKSGQAKVDILLEMLIQEEFSKVIVFGSTKHGISKLEQQLFQKGIRVTSIHGNKNQNARQRSLNEFKFGKVQALLATDVVARGIDVDDVTHVINYDEPNTYEDYVHRIGRTGRAGKLGKAITFVV